MIDSYPRYVVRLAVFNPSTTSTQRTYIYHLFNSSFRSITALNRTGIGMVKKSDTPKKKNQFYVEIDVWNAEKGNVCCVLSVLLLCTMIIY